jgi:hypothetical protein
MLFTVTKLTATFLTWSTVTVRGYLDESAAVIRIRISLVFNTGLSIIKNSLCIDRVKFTLQNQVLFCLISHEV